MSSSLQRGFYLDPAQAFHKTFTLTQGPPTAKAPVLAVLIARLWCLLPALNAIVGSVLATSGASWN
jgi:hypothetical protein